jgi:membrane dipeptidase
MSPRSQSIAGRAGGVTRREFAWALPAGIALARSAWSGNASADARTGAHAQARGIVIDGLSEAFDASGKLPLSPDDLAAAKGSGLSAVNFTVVGPGASFEETVRAIAFVERVAEQYPDRFLMVRKHADIAKAAASGRLGLILGFQTTEMLGADLSRIDLFRNLGVRIMQMTYNVRNLFGDGCLEPAGAGLSNLGRAAVGRMNALGIAIDLSHCGTRTTAETIAASTRPVLITHTGCSAVFAHPRNKDDKELRAAAERGGVVGIYLMPYLDGGTGPLTPSMFLAHWEHALKVCGEDHVGIGSDQSVAPIRDTPEYRTSLRKEIEERKARGVSAPGESPDRPPFIPEFNAVARMEKIASAIRARGYSESVIAKTCGGNFDRVLREVWGD